MLSKLDIFEKVLQELDSIPKPGEGRTADAASYLHEIRKAFMYARRVMFSDNINRMRMNYEAFQNYINTLRE